MLEQLVIENVSTDTALRKVGQFFSTHISDVSPRAMGRAPQRAALDPTNVALQIRDHRSTVAAINSHTPIGMARAVATALHDPAAALKLLTETRILEHLAVAPRARGHGCARALVEAAEQRHRADGVGVWFGFVDQREHDALGFYQHLGFVPAAVAQLPGPVHLLGRTGITRRGTWFYKILTEQ